MDAATAGLVGAALGGGVTILKSFVDSLSQRRLEMAKAQWGREGLLDTELRTHVASVARELLSAQHSMEWLCALTDGDTVLSQAAVDTYHLEIHATYPKLLGAIATVSSLNERAYQDLVVIADKVFAIDNTITEALRGFQSSPTSASSTVSKQRAAATALYRSLPVSIARVMKDLRQ
jgi:hypothetical protein